MSNFKHSQIVKKVLKKLNLKLKLKFQMDFVKKFYLLRIMNPVLTISAINIRNSKQVGGIYK